MNMKVVFLWRHHFTSLRVVCLWTRSFLCSVVVALTYIPQKHVDDVYMEAKQINSVAGKYFFCGIFDCNFS